jgi:hypothetical protein
LRREDRGLPFACLPDSPSSEYSAREPKPFTSKSLCSEQEVSSLISSALVKNHIPKAILISAFTAWMFIAMVLMLRALLYLYHPSITTLTDLEIVLYFSMVTFISVGCGDVVPGGNWRMLACPEAMRANGMSLFGWTTALIFYVIQYGYRHK